ncbi:MAG TPA: outer membrane protein assembly factor BamA, partial [Bacteroidales bacterium]|nr:outer membrane protein assembly factor BamA [Bacteroidales bacterium]
MNFRHYIFCIVLVNLFTLHSAFSQENISFTTPQKYIIGGITVDGVTYLQHPPIIRITGLSVGQKITVPGPDITNAVDRLWKQGLFGDIQIYASNIESDTIFLTIYLQERARLNTITIEGVKKRKQSELIE